VLAGLAGNRLAPDPHQDPQGELSNSPWDGAERLCSSLPP